MATKTGAGGQPQEYDESTGKYGGGRSFRQNTSHRELARVPLDFFAFDDVKALDNQATREWYVEQVLKIHEGIDQSLPIEEKAKLAFEARNRIRTQARDMMEDQELRKQLDQEHPNPTFEEKVSFNMQKRNMTREEAIAYLYESATRTNEDVNKRFNIGGK